MILLILKTKIWFHRIDSVILAHCGVRKDSVSIPVFLEMPILQGIIGYYCSVKYALMSVSFYYLCSLHSVILIADC